MAEQTFRSPGFFEQEIELIAGAAQPVGTPVGIAGTSKMGPAFVPVTVGNFEDFQSRFGGLDVEKPATYAANEWLKHRNSLTFVRVLGAGSNSTLSDIITTQNEGTVKNAGFWISGSAGVPATGMSSTASGSVVFITAKHDVQADSDYSAPMFVDNPSYADPNSVGLVRGMIFAAANTRIEVLSHDLNYSLSNHSSASLGTTGLLDRKFKIIISSSDPSFSTYSTDGFVGIRTLTASLDPNSESYISRILNTDPDLFSEKKHLLYADFPVDVEVARAATGATASVAVVSGSGAWLNAFGKFNTRYQAPKTTTFISQPFGKYEYDLFHFECISDGEISNSSFKVSIQNIIASTDKSNPYGTFDVVLRKFDDDDISPQILEYYPKLSLDPQSENYIAKKIGDKKVSYNFDSDDPSERRLLVAGKFANRSKLIRVVMNDRVETKDIPVGALPFGFRGLPVLKTSESLNDTNNSLTFDGQLFAGGSRLYGHSATASLPLSGAIVPPVPLRFKVTRGDMSITTDNIGSPGANERVDSRLYWGVAFQSVPTGDVLDPNSSVTENRIVRNLTKFLGIAKQDTLVTGSAADVFNANKFTLARVALESTTTSNVTGSADILMRGAAYVRDGIPDGSSYKINYGSSDRVTLATLIQESAVIFNRFTPYAKFTNVFYGGFDGLNILDRDNRKMDDRASSVEASANGSGKALGAIEAGLTRNAAGTGIDNNIVNSYRYAANILTDEFSSNANIVAIPGIRDSLVQDYIADRVRSNALMVHIRDIASYDDSGARLWEDSTNKPNVRYTSEAFASLNIDNNYTSVYYPDVVIEDAVNLRRVKVPSSIAVLGAIAYNDKVAYPWFAPAGFNRGALDFVKNVTVRLNSADRDVLYDSRINPIATFPAGGFVIFGQKTLQLSKSALDRLNVRRLMVEVKRIVAGEANKILFEQNTPATRARFVNAVIPKLGVIQAQAGIEKFQVVMDDTNNSQIDVDANRVNGRIVLVPTRTIEFIAIDFVITNSGVSFQ